MQVLLILFIVLPGIIMGFLLEPNFKKNLKISLWEGLLDTILLGIITGVWYQILPVTITFFQGFAQGAICGLTINIIRFIKIKYRFLFKK